MIVWENFADKPWRYSNEPDLRVFLLERARDGYSFPLNPVWPVRDVGWHDVLQALRDNSEAQASSLAAWFPPSSGLLEQIDHLHSKHPEGFVQLPGPGGPNTTATARRSCANAREKAELIMYTATKKAKAVKKKKMETWAGNVMTSACHSASNLAHVIKEHASQHTHLGQAEHPEHPQPKDGDNPPDASFQRKSLLHRVKQRFNRN